MEEFLMHHVHLDLRAKALEPFFPVGSLGIWTYSGEILGQLYAENMTYETYCGDRLGALGIQELKLWRGWRFRRCLSYPRVACTPSGTTLVKNFLLSNTATRKSAKNPKP